MEIEDFDYHLPGGLIAQSPSPARDDSRMMVIRRGRDLLEESAFHHLPEFLGKGDCLVVNDSKVIPARLIGRKTTGGRVEILLLNKKDEKGLGEQTWETLLRPAERIRPGATLHFESAAEAVILGRISDKKWLLHFAAEEPFDEFLEKYGRTPLPPYIRRKEGEEGTQDRIRYQTVYARVPGSVAAPTAGLHFSTDVIARLKEQGVVLASLTLHVGYGTFLPVESKVVEDHVMEKEYFEIAGEAADTINNARRVIAVGTTTTRVLESVADESGRIHPASGWTDLYIYPGYRFKRVEGMTTNFHLPRSSLFILVCAFAGTGLIRRAYVKAVRERYRFYSYGDCMLIL